MLVGEAPGKSEHYKGRPFVGKAGQVMNTYLYAAGVPRPDLRITNLYPYWPGEGNPDPTPEQIRQEQHRLEEEIRRVRPRVIGAVGRLAARWFLGDVNLQAVHGVPLWSKKAPGAVVVSITHPAAGFYKPDLAALSQDDFMRFAYYLRHPAEKKKPWKVKVPRVERMNCIGGAVDTEGLSDRPWGWSWSRDGKLAYVSTAPPASMTGRIIFHNALHDLPVLRAMGVDTTGLEYDDTMVMAYCLQLEPQMLKALAFRHLGLRMREFEEVVRPHFNKVAVAWLEDAAKKEYPPSKEIAVEDYRKRRWRVAKPWDTGRRIKAILKAWEKRTGLEDEEDEDELKLEKRWGKLEGEQRAQAEYAMESPFPEFSIFCVPEKEAVQYSGIDAAATAAIAPVLKTVLKEKGLEEVYETDCAALRFVDRMQEVGMRVEVPLLTALENDLIDLRNKARKKVQRLVGDRWFNPGSGDQVAAWMYGSKGVVPIKRTEGDKSRGSTSDEALWMVRGYHGDDEELVEFVTGIQDYRECDKYLGTFVRPVFSKLKQDVDGNWRVHPNFRVTRVVSGRLSSHDPNVLAFPSRTPLGARIRECFVAGEGYQILSADMSQIELRLGAHWSRDPTMMRAFENGEDLHALTASIIFKVPVAKVTKAQRYIAKTINFAVFYGITASALLDQLYKAAIFDFTLQQCEQFIAEWFKLYGSVREFQNRLWRRAERDGFVKTLFGRMCYVPNLRVVADKHMMEAARRLAANFPVQGSASDLVKRAEVRIHQYIEQGGMRESVRPWLQMHDELDLEVRADMVEEVKARVVSEMLADQEYVRVPLKVEAGVGDSWGEAK